MVDVPREINMKLSYSMSVLNDSKLSRRWILVYIKYISKSYELIRTWFVALISYVGRLLTIFWFTKSTRWIISLPRFHINLRKLPTNSLSHICLQKYYVKIKISLNCTVFNLHTDFLLQSLVHEWPGRVSFPNILYGSNFTNPELPL